MGDLVEALRHAASIIENGRKFDVIGTTEVARPLLRDAADELERVTAALREYGRHEQWCPSWRYNDRACTCGFSDALAGGARAAHEGETCQDCGSPYDTVYHLPDEAWKRICPKPYDGAGSGGLLCLPCADRRARSEGIHLFFGAGVGEFPAGGARAIQEGEA